MSTFALKMILCGFYVCCTEINLPNDKHVINKCINFTINCILPNGHRSAVCVLHNYLFEKMKLKTNSKWYETMQTDIENHRTDAEIL